MDVETVQLIQHVSVDPVGANLKRFSIYYFDLIFEMKRLKSSRDDLLELEQVEMKTPSAFLGNGWRFRQQMALAEASLFFLHWVLVLSAIGGFCFVFFFPIPHRFGID